MRFVIGKKKVKATDEPVVRLALCQDDTGKVSVHTIDSGGGHGFWLLTFHTDGTLSRIGGVPARLGFSINDGGQINEAA